MPDIDAPPAGDTRDQLLAVIADFERRNEELQAKLDEFPSPHPAKTWTGRLLWLAVAFAAIGFCCGFRFGSRFWSGERDANGVCHQPGLIP